MILLQPTQQSISHRRIAYHCSPHLKKTFASSLMQSLLSLILIVGLLGKFFSFCYQKEVSPVICNCVCKLTGTDSFFRLDRSGTYGGAQGIGGLETAYLENSAFTYGAINNYFGDVLGIVAPTYHNPAPYPGVVGGYGPMPGSEVNHDLEPQWRSRYIDETGLYYMGARYYDPQEGRVLSADPLGHGSSWSLYDYCNGDPVNGLDPDGRCVEGIGAAGSIVASATFGGPAGYVGVNYGTDRLGITDTSTLNGQQQFEYNTQVANLTEATQGTMFALAGARSPVNRISYEPMRFEVGTEEPAVISRAVAPSPWPDNAGFIEGTVEREFLMPGTTFDRFGFAGGRFVSPTGTPISMRAMRAGTELLPYNNYRTLKPIEVNAGGVMPSFNQSGLGKQYELPVPIRTLEKRGFIENIQNE